MCFKQASKKKRKCWCPVFHFPMGRYTGVGARGQPRCGVSFLLRAPSCWRNGEWKKARNGVCWIVVRVGSSIFKVSPSSSCKEALAEVPKRNLCPRPQIKGPSSANMWRTWLTRGPETLTATALRELPYTGSAPSLESGGQIPPWGLPSKAFVFV